jgi:phage shock protein A
MSSLVERLRAEVDEDVNEPLDRLLDQAADRIEALENTLRLHAGDVMSLNNEVNQCRLEIGELLGSIEDLDRQLAARRPDPTPDKINEAFKRATRC